jgi:ATP-dependent RNA helicase RhlB
MSEAPESLTPHLRAEKPEFLTEQRFDELDLPAQLQSNLREAGFIYCTPIQEQTLPISLSGLDVAGQAQTGTGKTAAFLVTVITRILAFSERDPRLPAALIVAPTRELSHQIYEEARTLCRYTDLKITEVVGGIDYKRQAEILRRGTDIVICTPGHF